MSLTLTGRDGLVGVARLVQAYRQPVWPVRDDPGRALSVMIPDENCHNA